MIRLRQLTLARGSKLLLEQADAAIAAGERVALIGDNGSGKSSLLDVLAGEAGIDGGDLEIHERSIARLDQSMPMGNMPAWRFVAAGDAELVAAERALAQAQAGGDGVAIASTYDDWLERGGAGAEARAGELLHGLGFSPADATRAVDEFSGGWKMRLNLARALMPDSSLLLLDEPTNHLDLDAVLWLERRLLRHPGTLVVVSHDRDFLDRVATCSLHIDQRKLVRYAGGYSAFEQARAERSAQLERAAERQQQQVARLTSFIERFRAKATKARQAQSRVKALERMKALVPLRASRGVDFEFPPVGDTPDPLVRLDGVSAGYPGRVVIGTVSMTIGRGARIGILGRNGAGKTTLVRTLVGQLAPIAGRVESARSVRIGYFAQQQIESLRPEDSALAHLQRLAPDAREQVLRDFAGRFGFRGEDATRPIGPMSGGERSRLALAMLVWQAPQLLVLDEPTNHLDAVTRDALADALAEFDGALLLVSHDRYLLRATVDRFVRVDRGRVEEFEGDLDDYAQWLVQSESAGGDSGADARAAGAAPESSRRETRRAAAEARQRAADLRKPFERRIAAIERELEQTGARLSEIDAALGDPTAYDDGAAAAALLRERGELAKHQQQLEDEWLEQTSAMEAALAAAED